MTIVMGLDQHRAQITAEWLDTETGEIARSADLAGAPRTVSGSSVSRSAVRSSRSG